MTRTRTKLSSASRASSPLSALLLFAACSSEASSAVAPAQQATPVNAVTLALQDAVPISELTGRFEAIHHVDIRPRVSGYITVLNYREGAEVPSNSVMFTIDQRPYRAAYDRATAQLASARARVDLARLEAGRGERLLAQDAIQKAERDRLVSTADQAAAEVQSAQASLELARLDLEFTQMRAPVAGRVGRAIANVGDYVTAGGAPVTSIVSTDPMYVYFTADEAAYLRFASHAEATKVEIGLADESAFPHEGTVDFVDNKIDASTGTILVRAVVPNHDKYLTPGLFARVRLPESAAVKLLMIDDRAIATDQDRKYVYVVLGDSLEHRDVKLGQLINGKRVITSGLKAGDQVVVDNLQRLAPGMKVAITKAVP